MFAHSKFPKTTQQCPRRQPFLVKNQGQALFFLFSALRLRWVFNAACRLSLVAESRGHSSWHMGFSVGWLLLLQSMSSREYVLIALQNVESSQMTD